MHNDKKNPSTRRYFSPFYPGEPTIVSTKNMFDLQSPICSSLNQTITNYSLNQIKMYRRYCRNYAGITTVVSILYLMMQLTHHAHWIAPLRHGGGPQFWTHNASSPGSYQVVGSVQKEQKVGRVNVATSAITKTRLRAFIVSKCWMERPMYL